MNIIGIIWKIFQSKPRQLDKDASASWQELFDTRFNYERLVASSAVVYSVKCN